MISCRGIVGVVGERKCASDKEVVQSDWNSQKAMDWGGVYVWNLLWALLQTSLQSRLLNQSHLESWFRSPRNLHWYLWSVPRGERCEDRVR